MLHRLTFYNKKTPNISFFNLHFLSLIFFFLFGIKSNGLVLKKHLATSVVLDLHHLNEGNNSVNIDVTFGFKSPAYSHSY